MRNTSLVILLIMVSGLNLFAQKKMTDEEYAVYAGVFEKYYENFKPDKTVIHLAVLKNTVEPNFSALEVLLKDKRKTDYLFSASLPDRIIRFDFEEAVTNLKEKSSNSVELETRFPIEYKYSLVTESEIEMLLEEGRKELAEYFKTCNPCIKSFYFWEPFLKKYRNSNGYYSLSRVGFSEDGKLALVYYTIYRGDKFSWDFYVLQKGTTGWKPSRRLGGGWVK